MPGYFDENANPPNSAARYRYFLFSEFRNFRQKSRCTHSHMSKGMSSLTCCDAVTAKGENAMIEAAKRPANLLFSCRPHKKTKNAASTHSIDINFRAVKRGCVSSSPKSLMAAALL